ncbi:hypothetical protein [Pseudoxanthomonas sp. UTMC 1351]|uniref:hypothetical protein n=1 Tax=Pseudoxanthomonas sp. UTMC 1351 TaxID=2695853 RepID=UPI0034CEAE99
MDQIVRLADAGYIRVLHRAKGNLKLPNQYMLDLQFGIQEQAKAPINDPHLVVNYVHINQ